MICLHLIQAPTAGDRQPCKVKKQSDVESSIARQIWIIRWKCEYESVINAFVQFPYPPKGAHDCRWSAGIILPATISHGL